MTLQEARQSLQTATQLAAAGDSGATQAELGQHKYRLGRVLWALGGRLRTERGGAHASFLAAAGRFVELSLLASLRLFIHTFDTGTARSWAVLLSSRWLTSRVRLITISR